MLKRYEELEENDFLKMYYGHSLILLTEVIFSLNCAQGAPGLRRTFTHAAHKGAVKSLACAGPFMASGGADDLIHLYDMKSDRDLGFLMIPGQGAVTCLAFYVPISGYTPTHLLAGCADGTLTIWKAGGGWECLKTFRKGHLGEITGIAVHPSGALALSTSRDGTLRLWDLVKGRAIFTTKVEKEPGAVVFAPSGTKYAIQAEDKVALHSVDVQGSSNSGTNQPAAVQLQHPRRVTSMTFGNEDVIIITGTEDGSLSIWDTSVGVSKPILVVPRAHETRIKAMSLVRSVPSTEKTITLATGSSDGVIKVWNLEGLQVSTNEREGTKATCQCEVETRARITTLCAVDPVHVMDIRLKEEAQLRRTKQKLGKKLGEEKERLKNVRGAAALSKKSKRKDRGSKQDSENNRVKQEKVVSFIQPTDVDRQKKKMRKIKINADRAANQRQKGVKTKEVKRPA